MRLRGLSALPGNPGAHARPWWRARPDGRALRIPGMSEGTIARPVAARRRLNAVGTRLGRYASGTFILPAVLIILAVSIFPLVASLYVSLTRIKFAQGGIEFTFVGLDNYAKLLVGIDHEHFLGVLGNPSVIGFAAGVGAAAAPAWWVARYIRGGATVFGLVGRIVALIGISALVWLSVGEPRTGGRTGATVVAVGFRLIRGALPELLP